MALDRWSTSSGAIAADSGPVWRTCLREVTFLEAPEPSVAIRTNDGELEGAEAYRFLLEVICGLRSPLAGETQVQGQFKSFIESLEAGDRWLRRIGDRLLADAKAVREAHLRGLGSRSYGTAVRRQLDGCRRVALVGSGALATELLPFVADGRVVDQWSRRPTEAPVPSDVRIHHHTLSAATATPARYEPTAVVLAAPVGAGDIDAVARRYAALVRILDLRAERERTPLDVACPVITLEDIFAQAAQAKSAAASHIAEARRAIDARAHAWAARAEFRPFGWDDLCA